MDFVGVFVTKTLSVNGRYDFHVDESLANGNLRIPAMIADEVSTGSGFQVAVEGEGGARYAVQYSTNLTDWTAVETNRSPYTFTDTNAVSMPQRFYRAVLAP